MKIGFILKVKIGGYDQLIAADLWMGPYWMSEEGGSPASGSFEPRIKRGFALSLRREMNPSHAPALGSFGQTGDLVVVWSSVLR